MRVLRIAHHAVVSAWRERERQLRRQGARVALLSARVWNEGGRDVALHADGDVFVRGVRTFGTHPNAFVYDPVPIWRALGGRPDLLDLHEEPFALATAEILALRALRRRREPYLLYSAQNIDKRYPIPFRWFEAYALRHAAGAYVCNREAGEILERKGLPVPATYIPLGVDTAAFTPRERVAPGGQAVIGYIGRLEPHKGVATLVRAVAAESTWTLQITGDGSERAALVELAATLGAADRVVFRGFADGADLAERYRELDVVAVPSVPTPGWLEQFCRVAVEAMAAGVPVVASRTGAIPDVVADAGVLVEPGDAAALGRGIREALDPSRWEQLRTAGLAHAQDFTWDRVAAAHAALYRAVAGEEPDAGVAHPPQIAVVAYGSPDLLRGALAALGGALEVTIVDNSSSPETRALAEEVGACYVDAGANLGFGGGVNVALRSLAERGLADRDVLLLNPDARIGPDGVRRMQEELHRGRRVAAVGAAQTDPATGEAVRVWWPFPTPVRQWIEAIGLGRLNRAHDFAIGSLLMLRADAVAAVGPFDERFFLYSEETDWQRRAVDAGWRIAVADVEATHIGAATSSDSRRRERYFHASAEKYVRKHHGAPGWQVYRGAVIAGSAVRGILLPGDRGRAARERASLYLRGPAAHEPERT